MDNASRCNPADILAGFAENEAPRCLTAGGPPLPPCLREKKILSYKVLIHIKSVADFTPRPPSDDGDSGHDGNPDNTHFSRGAGSQLHGFHCTRGIIDGEYGGAPGCNGGGGGHDGGRSRGHTAPAPGPNGSRRAPIGAAAAGPQRHQQRQPRRQKQKKRSANPGQKMAVWRAKTAHQEAGAPVPPQIQNTPPEITGQVPQTSPEDHPTTGAKIVDDSLIVCFGSLSFDVVRGHNADPCFWR